MGAFKRTTPKGRAMFVMGKRYSGLVVFSRHIVILSVAALEDGR